MSESRTKSRLAERQINTLQNVLKDNIRDGMLYTSLKRCLKTSLGVARFQFICLQSRVISSEDKTDEELRSNRFPT
jgi:predicted HAD superfamily hydrolase